MHTAAINGLMCEDKYMFFFFFVGSLAFVLPDVKISVAKITG